MTQQRYLPQALLASVALAAAAALFLLPSGEALPHDAFALCVLLGATALGAFAYARLERGHEPARDAALRPAVDWYVIEDMRVPEAIPGEAPLIALVADGQLPHPDMLAALVPYFADPSVAYVQGATRYDGEGGVADAFRAQAALGQKAAAARSALGCAPLLGSGAVIAREALSLRRPGESWEALGLRLLAAGYRGRFVEAPTMLAWAPQSPQAFAHYLTARTRRAAHEARLALTLAGLPLEARFQELGAAAAVLLQWAGALLAVLTAVSLVLFDAGPVIATSHSALAGDLLVLVGGAGLVTSLFALTGVSLLSPAALALSGAYTAAWEEGKRAATSPRVRALAAGALHAYRAALATVRAGGSADTAPAGTPAHS